MYTFSGNIVVQPSNTINIAFGPTPESTREEGMRLAQRLIAENPKGFDASQMKLVKPQPPFKPQDTSDGSNPEPKLERYQDSGLHVTIAMQGAWVDKDGNADDITEKMATDMNNEQTSLQRNATLGVDLQTWCWLEGKESNDKGTGAVSTLQHS